MRVTRGLLFGISLGFVASFLWAAYYPLILVTPGGENGLVLIFPFLCGGLPFIPFAISGYPRSDNGAAGFPPWSYLLGSGVLLLGLQLDVIISTRVVGAVPTALFTLLGDVLFIPIISYLAWGEGRRHLSAPLFWVGVATATIGASLAILSGGFGSAGGLYFVVLEAPLPLMVGLYFAVLARVTGIYSIGKTLPVVTLTAFALSAAGVIVFTGGVSQFTGGSLDSYLDLAVVGATTFFIAPWAFFEASRRLSVVVPAVINATIPIFTMVLVVTFLHAPILPIAVLGVPLAFGGALLATMSGKDLHTDPV